MELVSCIDCKQKMEAGLACYTFEGEPICVNCQKIRYENYIKALAPVTLLLTTCKACNKAITITNKEKPFCFDCWCEFILKQGKRNKDQLNIFEVLQ